MVKDTLEKTIYELEKSLMTSEVRQSANKIQTLLSEEFFEFCSCGKRYDYQKGDVFSGDCSYEIRDFAVKRLSEHYILATYQTIRIDKDGHKTRQLRSSLWQEDNGLWKMTFHQGTPTE